MRGKVLRSFVSNEPRVRASRGETIELPEDVDWVRAGLVEELPDEEPPVIDLDELNVPGMDKKYQNRIKKLVEDASLVTPEKAVSREKGKGESQKAKGQGQAVAPTKKPTSRSKTKK